MGQTSGSNHKLQWLDDERVRCWACKRWVSKLSLQRDDGHCPICAVEVDLTEAPYVAQPAQNNARGRKDQK